MRLYKTGLTASQRRLTCSDISRVTFGCSNTRPNSIGIQRSGHVGQVCIQKVMSQVEMNGFTRPRRTAFLKDDKIET